MTPGQRLLNASEWGGNSDAMREVLAMGTNPNVTNPELDGYTGARGLTALHYTASQGYLAATELLLDHPLIDLSIRDSRGKTALDRAIEFGRTKIVEAFARAAEKRETWRKRIQQTLEKRGPVPTL